MTPDTTRTNATPASDERIAPGDLAGLLGARLCHDLVSPLGAIGNGVELLEMSSDYPGLSRSPEMRLIAEAVTSARARIQGYRMAFGTASGDQRVAHGDLVRLLSGMSDQGRLRLTLTATGDVARAEVRMLMLAVMCLETALPWGGEVVIAHRAPLWRLTARFERCRHDPDLWAWLDGRAGRSPDPAEVQFPLLAEAARTRPQPLRHRFEAASAELSF